MNQATEKRCQWLGLDLIINDRVLTPREETALLVYEAVSCGGEWIHEVGTGSGAVALAIKNTRPDLIVTASDIDPHAVEVAIANADRLDLDVGIWQGPGLSRLDNLNQGAPFPDLIVANLPYLSDEALAKRPAWVAEEPEMATQGECGPDGLGEIRQLISETPPGLLIALEHDTHHGPAVREMLDEAHTEDDYSGNERMTVGIVKANEE